MIRDQLPNCMGQIQQPVFSGGEIVFKTDLIFCPDTEVGNSRRVGVGSIITTVIEINLTLLPLIA